MNIEFTHEEGYIVRDFFTISELEELRDELDNYIRDIKGIYS